MIVGITLVKKESKRFPNKHFAKFNGTTLFEHCMTQIMLARNLDDMYVISNDERIQHICEPAFVTFFKESKELAELDEVYKALEAMMLNELDLNYEDIVVFLPANIPLRESNDIDKAIELFQIINCESVISVNLCAEPPQWSFRVQKNGLLKMRYFPIASQELTPHYHLNGAIYISTVRNLITNGGFFNNKVKPYYMPKERSIDIDCKEDLELAKYYYNKKVK